VHAFLNHVAHQMSLSLNQLQDLREKNLVLEGKMTQVSEYEDHLKSALITATQYTEGAKENARREAEILIKEAQVEAQRIVGQAKIQLLQYQEEIKLLEKQKYRFLVEMRALIQSHTRVLQQQEDVEMLVEQKPQNLQSHLENQSKALSVIVQDEAIKPAKKEAKKEAKEDLKENLKENLKEDLKEDVNVDELSNALSAAFEGNQEKEVLKETPMPRVIASKTMQKSGIANLQDVLSKTPSKSYQEMIKK
jgi:cell division initiation protein